MTEVQRVDKKSREQALKQLIRWCRSAKEDGGNALLDPQLLQLYGILGRLGANPFYKKDGQYNH